MCNLRSTSDHKIIACGVKDCDCDRMNDAQKDVQVAMKTMSVFQDFLQASKGNNSLFRVLVVIISIYQISLAPNGLCN